jgi:hypothetical protein
MGVCTGKSKPPEPPQLEVKISSIIETCASRNHSPAMPHFEDAYILYLTFCRYMALVGEV